MAVEYAPTSARPGEAPPGHQGGAHIQPPAASTTTYLEVATSDQVLDALEPVLGPNIELVENRHNHVSIYRAASTDRLHRDILQWSRSILTVLVYLSDCTDLDSATRVVPGSHLWPCIGKPNNGGT
ncbi:MAG: hypothetical protein JWM18_3365 [Chloroflexi bacterium]|nr:hypothetical protein [Chloroflexota bacterium]